MFQVGDEVVCVPCDVRDTAVTIAALKAAGYKRPQLGNHYTVRNVFRYQERVGLHLVELVNPPISNIAGKSECGWDARSFRKIKPESVALFRAMCVSPKPLVPVE